MKLVGTVLVFGAVGYALYMIVTNAQQSGTGSGGSNTGSNTSTTSMLPLNQPQPTTVISPTIRATYTATVRPININPRVSNIRKVM